MSLLLTLTGGEQAEAVRLDGERLHLVSPRAFAPGAPICLCLGGDRSELQGRCQLSKRRADGLFDVRLRLVNFTRQHRELLKASL